MKDLLLKVCHALKASNRINSSVADWSSATQQRNETRAAHAKGPLPHSANHITAAFITLASSFLKNKMVTI